MKKLYDDYLYKALEQYNKSVADALPSEDELTDISFSENFERHMDELIQNEKKAKTNPFNVLIKCVSYAACIMVAVAVCAMTAQATRGDLEGVYFKTYDGYDEFYFDKTEPISPSEFVLMLPSYIPEGFELETTDVDSDSIFNIYENEDGDFVVFSQCHISNLNFSSDNELIVESELIYLNGVQEAMYKRRKRIDTSIYFKFENYFFRINSTLPKEELIKVAESIELMKERK